MMTYPCVPASPPRAGQGAVQLAGHDCLAQYVPWRPQEIHQGAGLRLQVPLLVPDGVAAPLCHQLQRTERKCWVRGMLWANRDTGTPYRAASWWSLAAASHSAHRQMLIEWWRDAGAAACF